MPEAAVSDFVSKLHQQKGIKIDYRLIPGANHFFHDCTDLMIEHVHDHMNKANGGVPVQVKVSEAA